ncbi:MAG TPA: hypothetical protein PKD58_03995 [Candidatus Sumerlaeota bacterium]|nr:hypothetical protein [Candidatus Sumerlaeota bacterium]HMZ52604.1 hypothetical protein [Candidatus Sumerlaeota bacterium]
MKLRRGPKTVVNRIVEIGGNHGGAALNKLCGCPSNSAGKIDPLFSGQVSKNSQGKTKCHANLPPIEVFLGRIRKAQYTRRIGHPFMIFEDLLPALPLPCLGCVFCNVPGQEIDDVIDDLEAFVFVAAQNAFLAMRHVQGQVTVRACEDVEILDV